MALLFIRHGETALNVARVLQPSDTPLSQQGLTQARALGARLAASGIAHILSSDLPRALQTAQAIAAATGAAIETTPLLHERNFGELRGQHYDTLGWDPIESAEAAPGGESLAEFQARVALAFALAVQRRAALTGALAVVTHGLVVRQVLDRHVALAAGQLPPHRMRNASLTIASLAPPHAVELIDCTRHLDETARHAEASLSGG
jgi:probable phosphoglycerate mutase